MAAPPPPGINLNADIRASVIGVDITLVAIATFFVALRFLARYTSKLAIQWDDYLVVLALVFAYATGGLSIVGAHYGVGRHIWNPTVDVDGMVKTLWAYEFMYGAVVSITKLSIIMFYRRIFAVRTFTYVLWFLLSITIGWWVAVYIVAIVQCRPYYFFWKQYTDPTAHGHCINVSSFFVGNAAASVVTDCLILASPIPMVWRLRMPVTQKLAVCGIFLLGGFVCVAGIVRIHFLLSIASSPDLSWNLANSFIWSCTEPCIGIVSACLPTLRPLVRQVFPRLFSKRSTTAGTGSNGPKHLGAHSGRDFRRLQDSGKIYAHDDEIALTTNIGLDSRRKTPVDGDNGTATNNISVKSDIEWASTDISSHDGRSR